MLIMRILALASNDWDGPWMNRQQILSRLGKRHQIIYSNGLWDIWQRNSNDFLQAPVMGAYTYADNVLIDTAPKYLLRWPSRSVWDELMIRFGVMRWRHKLDKLNAEPLLAYLFHPKYWPFVKPLQPDYLVYHAYDLYRLIPKWNDTLECYQRELLAHANIVLGSSTVITNDLSLQAKNKARFLPNGVDYDLYANEENTHGIEPGDLQDIPHPRIGYTGNINRKVDIPLILDLARKNKLWQFVLVGGVANLDDVTNDSFQKCLQTKNIHLLGEKKPKELPKYVNNMDVNIMAYRISDKLWTQGIYPLKLHEYLASGKPVVSAEIPAIREFDHVVRVVRDNADDWGKAIASALDDNSEARSQLRRQVAQQNTWDSRVNILNQYFETMSILPTA